MYYHASHAPFGVASTSLRAESDSPTIIPTFLIQPPSINYNKMLYIEHIDGDTKFGQCIDKMLWEAIDYRQILHQESKSGL